MFCVCPHKKLNSRLKANGSCSLAPPLPIRSSPPWPRRDAVEASDDAREEAEPGGMNGDDSDDEDGGDGDEKKEGPAAEVVEGEGGEGAVPGADIRWCAVEDDEGEKEG
ncbi:hypothetical protein PoB_006521800 [Plakobranchus ocellatus]|uniref:Uncharacterized protein n=1 Tax=Plakobranchus ocellatus TaxID=259542 RepID=A0AAV4D3F6_9GAST|nr:hypothetical protein PoB_006521800 [Plakobranchus ocellatus]